MGTWDHTAFRVGIGSRAIEAAAVSAHRATGVHERCAPSGARLVDMPGDSPDLHPVALCGRPIETLWRRFDTRAITAVARGSRFAAEFVGGAEGKHGIRRWGYRAPPSKGWGL